MRNNKSGNLMTIAMVGAVIVVLALGIFALVPKLVENAKINRLSSGDMNAIRVSDMSDTTGMEVDEFIEYYGVADDGIKGNSSLQELREKLAFGKYVEFGYGAEITEEDFAAFKEANEFGDEVTLDSQDMEVKEAYDVYYYELQAAAAEEAEAAEDEAAVTEGELVEEVEETETAE